MTLDINKMNMAELKQIIKMIIRDLNSQNDKIAELQNRIFTLEMKLQEKQ